MRWLVALLIMYLAYRILKMASGAWTDVGSAIDSAVDSVESVAVGVKDGFVDLYNVGTGLFIPVKKQPKLEEAVRAGAFAGGVVFGPGGIKK